MKEKRKLNTGQSSVELALLTPLLAVLFFAVVQAIILLESSIVAQYGAFVAARSYQVYGERTLQTTSYPHVREHPFTNAEQTLAEAAAEKVIFESLLWEHKRITVIGGPESMDRFYKDGNDVSQNGISRDPTQGAVSVNFRFSPERGQGVDVTYCAPIRFPGTDALFALAKKKNPCHVGRAGENYDGISLTKSAEFGVEPEVEP